MKTCLGGGGIAPRIPNLGMPWCLFKQEIRLHGMELS